MCMLYSKAIARETTEKRFSHQLERRFKNQIERRKAKMIVKIDYHFKLHKLSITIKNNRPAEPKTVKATKRSNR